MLAYSTVSQLGYMMLALGVGGWVAGLFHLITHAFFKSLLVPVLRLGDSRRAHERHAADGRPAKKMPLTAYTMLVGCLAIAGAGIPLVDRLQRLLLEGRDPRAGAVVQQRRTRGTAGCSSWPLVGAAITAFYMFRLWFMTFAGEPRDQHVYEHAHESPRVMSVPLVVLAFFGRRRRLAGPAAPRIRACRPCSSRRGPPGIDVDVAAGSCWPVVSMPAEHPQPRAGIHVLVALVAFCTALVGFLVAAAYLRPAVARSGRRATRSSPDLRLLGNKWYFDELYDCALRAAGAGLSRVGGRAATGRGSTGSWTARPASSVASRGDRRPRRPTVVDGMVNRPGRLDLCHGRAAAAVQTGQLRQYVMFMVVGTVAMFVLVSFFWGWLI